MTAPVAADTELLYASLGYPADVDSSGSLLAWLDGIGQLLQVVDDLCRDGTDTNGNPAPGWSQTLDVLRAPTYVLPWLGQFVGVRVDPAASDAAQRSAIQNEAGFQRGTIAALTAVAQSFLTGSKLVTITERTTDAYHLTIQVFEAQLVGLSYGALSAAYPTYSALTAAFSTYAAFTAAGSQIAAALQAAKPAGLVLTVSISNGASYGQLSAGFPLYSQLVPKFTTYAPMTSWIPGT